MAVHKPKPITLVKASAALKPGDNTPQPFEVYGDGIVVKQPAITNQSNAGTLADLAAAQTAINSLTAKLNAALGALRAAGVIAP